MKRFYGWHRDHQDTRDFKLSYYGLNAPPLPHKVDLRSKFSTPLDQGDCASCTAHAWAGLFEYELTKKGYTRFIPSRLFIYYNERVLSGNVSEDSGAYLRDGAKVLANLGGPHESYWWYNTAKFAIKPSHTVYEDALNHKISQYQRLDGTVLYDLKACLAGGDPFVFGFMAYESFESAAVAKSGVLDVPNIGEQQLGGHAVLAVGYDDMNQVFIVRNSWGSKWGQGGYFTMPYGYVTSPHLACDFWTAKAISNHTATPTTV